MSKILAIIAISIIIGVLFLLLLREDSKQFRDDDDIFNNPDDWGVS